MEKILIIFNFQRELPPFMITEIKIAKDLFKNVVYITPKLYNDNSYLINYPNVKIIQGSNFWLLMNIYKLPFIIFRNEIINDIKYAINNKRFNLEFFKVSIKSVFYAEHLTMLAKKTIKRYKYNDYIICGMSAWFSCEAYALVQLKKKYPQIYTSSLAHAFEIDPLRNDYIDLNKNRFLHTYLDNINFISKKKFYTYKINVMDKYNIDSSNITFYYLGCIKIYDEKSQASQDGVLRILTCSGINDIKRLNLLLPVLEKWGLCKLEWTHIGSGPLYDEIKTNSLKVVEKNSMINICFKGYMENSDVQLYYTKNYIDIFLNISSSEGLPISIMESMAYGVPVIATNVGGNSEIVNSDCGILIDENFKTDELLELLKIYYLYDQSIKNRYRVNAYNQWKNNFNAISNMNNYLKEIFFK